MRRLVLVANPAASAFTAGLHRDVVRILTGPFDVTPVWPNGPADARRVAADAAAEGYDVVAAMGGDGVVHQIAASLIGTDTALGIIPAGTANVFRRILGLPSRPRAAAEIITSGESRAVGTGRVSISGLEGGFEDIVLFAAGAGMDAAVVERAEREPLRKVRFGPIHYARSAAAVALGEYRSRLPHIRVEAHGRRSNAVTVLIQVHGSWTYFGPLPLGLSPQRPFPGMTVLTIERLNARRMGAIVARALAGRDLNRTPGTEVWQGVERVKIMADPPAWFQSDGELLGKATEVTIAAEPRPLGVIVPGA